MPKSRIKEVLTAVICVLLCLSSACTTMRPLAGDSSGNRIRAEVKLGETVRVLMLSGAVHTITISKLDDASLSGNVVDSWKRIPGDVPGTQLELQYREIKQISVRRVNVLSTVGIVVVIVLATALGVASGGGRHTPGFSR